MQNYWPDKINLNQEYQPDGLRPNVAICDKCPHLGRDWNLAWIPARAHICHLPFSLPQDENKPTGRTNKRAGEILAVWATGRIYKGQKLPSVGYVPIECPYRLEHLYGQKPKA